MFSKERSLLELWNDPNQDEVLFVLQVITDKPSQGLKQRNTFIPAIILSPNTCKVIHLDPPLRKMPHNFDPLRYEQENVQLLPLQNGKAPGMLMLHSPVNKGSAGRYAFRVTEENGIEIRDPRTDVYFPLYYKDHNGRYKISGQLRQIELEVSDHEKAAKFETDRRKENEKRKLDTIRELLDTVEYKPTDFTTFHSEVYKAQPMRILEEERIELEYTSKQREQLMRFIEQIAKITPEPEEKMYLSTKFKYLEQDGIISNFSPLCLNQIESINDSKDAISEKLERLIKFKHDMRSFSVGVKSLEMQEEKREPLVTEVKNFVEREIISEIKKLQQEIIKPLEFYSEAINEGVLIKALIYLKIKIGVSLLDLTSRELDIVDRFPGLREKDLLNSLETADRITLENLISSGPGLLPLLKEIDKHVPGFTIALRETELPSSSPSVRGPAPFLSVSPSIPRSGRSSSSLSAPRPLPKNESELQTSHMAQVKTYAERLQRIVESKVPVIEKLRQLMKLKEEVRPFTPHEDSKLKLEEYENLAESLIQSIRDKINNLQEELKEQVTTKLDQYLGHCTNENERNLIRKISLYLRSTVGIPLNESTLEEDAIIEADHTLLKLDNSINDLVLCVNPEERNALQNEKLLDFIMGFTLKVPDLADLLFKLIILSQAIDIQKLQQINKLKRHIEALKMHDDNVKKLWESIELVTHRYKSGLNLTTVVPLEKFLAELKSNDNPKSKTSFLGWFTSPNERGKAEISPIESTVIKVIIYLKIWMGFTTMDLTVLELEFMQAHEGFKKSILNKGELLSALTEAEKKASQNPKLQKILKDIAVEVPQLGDLLNASPKALRK